jgi:uncharacterized protein GlcG (DUF336 family)
MFYLDTRGLVNAAYEVFEKTDKKIIDFSERSFWLSVVNQNGNILSQTHIHYPQGYYHLPFSQEFSLQKARTALHLRRPTGILVHDDTDRLNGINGYLNRQGGFICKIQGVIVGAFGISGMKATEDYDIGAKILELKGFDGIELIRQHATSDILKPNWQISESGLDF